jgi:DNA-binding NarL/FixJ family response regulator
MVRLLLVDHPPSVRRTLRAYLSLASDVAVVGEADDLSAALCLAEALRPDVILLDAEMPDADVSEAVPELLARSSASRIVILALHPDAMVRSLSGGPEVVVVGKHEGTAGLLAAARGQRS